MLSRRSFMAALAATSATPAFAQHAGHDPVYSHLTDPNIKTAPADTMRAQHVFDSPAPKAANQGKWIARAPLPLAAQRDGLGHRTQQQNAYRRRLRRAARRPAVSSCLRSGRRQVGERAAIAARRQSCRRLRRRRKTLRHRGFVEQNRKPDNLCYVLDGETWRAIAPLPKAFARDRLRRIQRSHPRDRRRHRRYVPGQRDRSTGIWSTIRRIDQWSARKPMPTGRDHTGTLTVSGNIHVIGGRVDSLPHQFQPASHLRSRRPTSGSRARRCRPRAPATARCSIAERSSSWAAKAPIASTGRTRPTTRPTDTWESFAPMTTPRHGLGAVAIGDFIHVAGGGPVMGGAFQSAVHEAFTLG